LDDERFLIRRLREGDRSVLGDLVDRHGEDLMQYLLSITGNRETAEDIFQETWVRVMEKISRFDPVRSFAPWLFRIARNKAFDHLRWRKRWRLFGFDRGEPEVRLEPERSTPDFSDRIIAKETADRLLDRLEPIYREIIGLRYYRERSYGEIAEICDLPMGTVKSRLKRALDRLADLYAREEGKVNE